MNNDECIMKQKGKPSSLLKVNYFAIIQGFRKVN